MFICIYNYIYICVCVCSESHRGISYNACFLITTVGKDALDAHRTRRSLRGSDISLFISVNRCTVAHVYLSYVFVFTYRVCTHGYIRLYDCTRTSLEITSQKWLMLQRGWIKLFWGRWGDSNRLFATKRSETLSDWLTQTEESCQAFLMLPLHEKAGWAKAGWLIFQHSNWLIPLFLLAEPFWRKLSCLTTVPF